ncbi:MAG: alternative ribosome rescue aminoacyl-tRNA hydrolase ArfB [Pseudomonadales bacterium]
MKPRITGDVAIPEEAMEFHFVRSPGPGGQNVNKVSTAVQLRVDLDRAGLPPGVRKRLERLAGRRVTKYGELVIEAHRQRTQARNREDAIQRLEDLVRRARHAPKPRIETQPSKAAKQHRLDTKVRRGKSKKLRRKRSIDF